MQVIEYGGTKEPMTIFLHGFPALRSKQNIEIAEGFAHATDRAVKVPLYDGLGRAPGTFRFSQTLDEVRAFVGGILNTRKEIDLVGHSWGGYMALSLAAEFGTRIRKMVLISPLLNFGTLEVVSSGFQEYAKNPLLTLPPASELSADFMGLGKKASGEDLIPKLAPETKILFLQAREDTTTLPSIAQASLTKFRSRPEFELVDNDHSFLAHRPELTKRITEFLQ